MSQSQRMLAKVRAEWRTFRNQPLWAQVVIGMCTIALAAFGAFLLYAFIVISIFGI